MDTATFLGPKSIGNWICGAQICPIFEISPTGWLYLSAPVSNLQSERLSPVIEPQVCILDGPCNLHFTQIHWELSQYGANLSDHKEFAYWGITSQHPSVGALIPVPPPLAKVSRRYYAWMLSPSFDPNPSGTESLAWKYVPSLRFRPLWSISQHTSIQASHPVPPGLDRMSRMYHRLMLGPSFERNLLRTDDVRCNLFYSRYFSRVDWVFHYEKNQALLPNSPKLNRTPEAYSS